MNSGRPYDVTLGTDLYGDTLKNARPDFATGPGPNIVSTPFGYFNTNPVPGSSLNLVPRDYLTAAGLVSFNLRVGRTFGFGPPRNPNAANSATDGMGGGGGRGRPGVAMAAAVAVAALVAAAAVVAAVCVWAAAAGAAWEPPAHPPSIATR